VNVNITDLTDTRKDVTVTLSGEEVAQEEQRILKDFTKQAKVPGFRPGKAPEARIRQLYGRALKEELRQAVMSAAYKQVSEHPDLDLYAVVEFPEPGDIPSGRELSLSLKVDVTPKFELPEYKGITTELPSTEVSDAEIQEAIDRIRRQRADFVVVERAAAAGDYVKVSYTGTLDGQPVVEQLRDQPRLQAWGSVDGGWEEAGTDEAKQFGVPAVIDALVGMQIGEKKTAEQAVPEDFPVEPLRGKTVTYALEALEVRERQLPEIDAEFLKSVKAESLEELKAQLLDQLEAEKKRLAEEAQRDQILQFLHGAVDFALPESALEGETQNAMGRIISQNMQRGVPEEEFEKHKEQIYAGATQVAQRDVKLQILLSRIARKEEIKVDNEDLSRALYMMAMQQRQRPEDLAKELRKDRNRLAQLQRQILFSKTLDFLRKEAKTAPAHEHTHAE